MHHSILSTSGETFQEQFCGWLSATGLAFEELEVITPFSHHLQIRNAEGLILQVVLINLAMWQQFGSSEDWNALISDVSARRKSGIRCVIIWEDFWCTRGAIVRSRLMAMLGKSQKIAARLTQARRIEPRLAAAFLQENHLNGPVSAKTCYGLFLPSRYFRVLNEQFLVDTAAEDLLVAVATYSAPRVFQRPHGPFRSFEMVRFASLLHTNVSGGLDKLITAFIRDKNPDNIMTYADLEWSEGAGYERLGFEKISQTSVIPFIIDPENMARTSRPEPVDVSMITKHKVLVYNAGSIKFVKTLWRPADE